ncbi:hypothetical protein IscW_ISCW010717 [Ixodes scapularis]|uniref:Peptidase M14 domain-containing protein n=1 Tax=Ixodes scapularis TaxID=6945 RepID=B7Q7H6_IXOSC|nr:hypothetical protein IscW_ISCW010717 [Ixodes scapularis]|eukprot:XP_002404050.1 hypothetical protein IscW_ISCW010717 [Ixodes scapularis]
MWRFASLVLCSVAVTSGAFVPDYAAYHNLSSAYRRVGALADAFPGFVRVDHSFKSRNGLSQLLVRLSNFSDSSHTVGPRVQSFKVKALLSYGESARELLPVESILHFLRRVLRGLGAPKDSAEEAFSRALFSKVDLYIVVLLNPDGRNHVERTGDHCWKGTGTGANLGTAFGLDVDRSVRGTFLLSIDAIKALNLHLEGSSLLCFETSTMPATVDTSQLSFPRQASLHNRLPKTLSGEFCSLFYPGFGLPKDYVHQIKILLAVPPVAAKLQHIPLTL